MYSRVITLTVKGNCKHVGMNLSTVNIALYAFLTVSTIDNNTTVVLSYSHNTTCATYHSATIMIPSKTLNDNKTEPNTK